VPSEVTLSKYCVGPTAGPIRISTGFHPLFSALLCASKLLEMSKFCNSHGGSRRFESYCAHHLSRVCQARYRATPPVQPNHELGEHVASQRCGRSNTVNIVGGSTISREDRPITYQSPNGNNMSDRRMLYPSCVGTGSNRTGRTLPGTPHA
jgi:hypothetical protein